MLGLSDTSIASVLISIAAIAIGAALSYFSGRAADTRRLRADDARRWLVDRRQTYGRFLGAVEQLHRDADFISRFLPSRGAAWKPEDELFVRYESRKWISRWEDEVQPLLGELELVASTRVVDLASRAAYAILEAVPHAQHVSGGTHQVIPSDTDEAMPFSDSARRIIDALRNAMRRDLGVEPVKSAARTNPKWPWILDDLGSA